MQWNLLTDLEQVSVASWLPSDGESSQDIFVKALWILDDPEIRKSYGGRVRQSKPVHGGTKAIELAYLLSSSSGNQLPDTFKSITIDYRTISGCKRWPFHGFPELDGEYIVEPFFFENIAP